MASRLCRKLANKYHGPYQIIKKIGLVTYKLQLPVNSKIHATFYVMLKKHHGHAPVAVDDTLRRTYDSDSWLKKIPLKALEIRTVKRRNVAMVQWLQQPSEEATWEPATEIIKKFPEFDPGDQGSFNGGSMHGHLRQKHWGQGNQVRWNKGTMS